MSTSTTAAAQLGVADGGAAEPPAASGPPRFSPQARRRLLVVLCVLAAALLAATAVFAVQVRQHNQVEQARADALRAAKQTALNSTTIGVDNFDVASARILEGTTADFKAEVTQNLKALKDIVAKNKGDSVGQVLTAGIVRSDLTNATVLVVVNATVKNVDVPDGRVSTYRMQIEVEKVGAKWLTSSLKFVG